MKKLSLLFVALLIGAVSFSQKIKVTVTEAQIFGKFGVHDPDHIINDPDIVKDNNTHIDCDYLLDLKQKTVSYILILC